MHLDPAHIILKVFHIFKWRQLKQILKHPYFRNIITTKLKTVVMCVVLQLNRKKKKTVLVQYVVHYRKYPYQVILTNWHCVSLIFLA